MTENSDLMDSRVIEVENDIITYFTSREWKKEVLLWCCSPDSLQYLERSKCMQNYINWSDKELFQIDALSTDLQYHIKLLVLLSSCNLGPKLQAIYPMNDIIYAILDRYTIFPVKKALGSLLIEIIKSNLEKIDSLVNHSNIKINYIL